MIDLGDNSLILTYDGKILHTSTRPKLRPLLELVIDLLEGKYAGYDPDGLVLTDKLIGLAAAKLIVHSKMLKHVETRIASKDAIDFLMKHGVEIYAEKSVDGIMDEDGTGPCPMELKSKGLTPQEFYIELRKMMKL